MSVPASPESLHELPQPYDISAAVAQALRINSSSSCEISSFRPARTPRTTKRTTSEANERQHALHKAISQTTEEAYDELIPELGAENLLDEVFDKLSLPDMDTDAWSEGMDSNREELERFCKYIDGEEIGDRLGPASATSGMTICTRRTQSQARAVTSYAPPVVELVNAHLWREFTSIGTEMVITKNGRYYSQKANIATLSPLISLLPHFLGECFLQ